MKNEKGFTLVELVTVLAAIMSIGLLGVVVYVAWHFVSKFW